METHNTTTGKIVSSPTDTTWAQSYSAGKLYTVLSLEGSAESGLAALGKETVEKLQREFFALDDKSLETIKKSVETAVSGIPEDVASSLVLTTVVHDAVYIVIVNQGHVILKRKDAISQIAQGESASISTFSGKFEPDDVFLLTTDSFLKSLSMERIKTGLIADTPHEISENLALVVHENSTGAEAALVVKMGGHVPKPVEESIETTDDLKSSKTEENNDHLELGEDTTSSDKRHALPAFASLAVIKKIVPKRLSKKQLIGAAIIVLLIVLGGGILMENNKRQSEKYNVSAASLIASHKGRYEEALAVMSLNKSLAVEDLAQIKTALESERNNFPEGSSARKSIDDFLKEVEGALGGNTPAANSPVSVFFEGKDSDLKSVFFVTQKGGALAAAGGTKAGILSSSGSVEDTFDSGNAKALSGSEDNIFIMTTDSVQKISKDSGEAEDIFDISSAKSMDTFGDNVYVLEGKTINKYRPNAYAKEAYFTGDTTLTDPSSIAIDSSIYVVDDGKIRKFTRGAEDSFSYSGPTLSNKSLAYTDEDYANLYVVDPTSKMVYVIDKSGNKVSEISLKGTRTITGIAANEKDKKIYVAADNKIYSINF